MARNMVSKSRPRSTARFSPYVKTALKVGSALYKKYNKRQRVSTVRARTVRRGVRFRTMGRGPYKVKKPRRMARRDMFKTHGSIFKNEFGGQISDPDTVLVGHGVLVTDIMMESTWRAILRILAHKMEHRIRGFDESAPAGTYRVYYYELTTSSTTSNFTYVNPANGTWNGIAANLTALFYTVNTLPHVRFDTFNYISPVGDGAQVSLVDCHVTMDIMSNIIIQNRTVAGVAADPASHNANDVANNPLIGRVFESSGTIVRFKDRHITPTSYADDLLLNRTHGFLTATGANMPNSNKIPMDGSGYEGYVKDRRLQLNPGELKKSSVYFKKSCQFQELTEFFYVACVQKTTGALPNQPIYRIGKLQWYCFEKVLNSRLDEPTISLGYEVNNITKIAVKERLNIVAPVVRVA